MTKKLFNFNGLNRIVVNGRVITNTGGGVVEIYDGKVVVNGKPVEDLNGLPDKVVNITIDGDVESLHVDCCSTVSVDGNVKTVKSGSGDVTVSGNVSGNISTGSGDVNCCNVEEGDVTTGSGDVHCINVGGRVSTGSGDIYRR